MRDPLLLLSLGDVKRSVREQETSVTSGKQKGIKMKRFVLCLVNTSYRCRLLSSVVSAPD